MWRIPETKEGLRSQRNRKENQDTPIQDLSLAGPTIWLWNLEDHQERWTEAK